MKWIPIHMHQICHITRSEKKFKPIDTIKDFRIPRLLITVFLNNPAPDVWIKRDLLYNFHF
jgi:hypothetical protein